MWIWIKTIFYLSFYYKYWHGTIWLKTIYSQFWEWYHLSLTSISTCWGCFGILRTSRIQNCHWICILIKIWGWNQGFKVSQVLSQSTVFIEIVNHLEQLKSQSLRHRSWFRWGGALDAPPPADKGLRVNFVKTTFNSPCQECTCLLFDWICCWG